MNFFSKNSELSKAIPLHTKKLLFLKNIHVPILALIGDQEEYTVIPIKSALKLLKQENKLIETHQIKNANHDFEGKEKEVEKIVHRFLLKIKLTLK